MTISRNNIPSMARLITKFLRSEIIRLFSYAGLVYKSVGFDIKVAPRSANFARILIIIPKKYGTAPQRNTLRRRIKTIFYQEKFFERSNDVLIFAKSAAKEYTYAEIRDILRTISLD